MADGAGDGGFDRRTHAFGVPQERGAGRGGGQAATTTRTAAGEEQVTLDAETQEHIGLQTVTVAETTRQPEAKAYGELQEDPSRGFVLRAPFAGVLEASEKVAWPAIGQTVEGGAAVAAIRPRLSPVERIDLTSRLLTARAEVEETDSSLVSARAAYEARKKLNSENKIVSDRALDEAEANVKGLEARRTSAVETGQLIEAALAPKGGATAALPMHVAASGEVVAVLAQPGESVEPGQEIARLARYDRMIARVELPAGQPFDAAAKTARIVALGYEAHPLSGERISLAAGSDARTRGAVMLFAVDPKEIPVRPGAAVTAAVPLTGEPIRGIEVPRSAVLRVGGHAWVYVRTGETTFVRRELPPDESTDSGWFVTKVLAPGDRIVTVAAQTVLSEELKSQIGSDEESMPFHVDRPLDFRFTIAASCWSLRAP